MKKILALALALIMIFALAACDTTNNPGTTTTPSTPTFDPSAKSEGTMTYAEYAAADLDSEVVVECFVQAHQSWWDNKITVYAADPDGAYFMYEMTCPRLTRTSWFPAPRSRSPDTRQLTRAKLRSSTAPLRFWRVTGSPRPPM